MTKTQIQTSGNPRVDLINNSVIRMTSSVRDMAARVARMTATQSAIFVQPEEDIEAELASIVSQELNRLGF